MNGLDISNYQEAPQYNLLIDWEALKSDPLDFQFIWIKSSEGESVDFYPVVDFRRQVEGARSVNFKSVQPYHFYYYHVPMDIDKWYVLSPALMAKAFKDSCAGYTFTHPMVDLEDPYVGRFLTYSDTASANAAILFASKVLAHIHKYMLEIEKLFGVRPDAYSADWWLSPITRLLINNGRANEVAWINDYKWIVANYTSDGPVIPIGMNRSSVIAWQKTSTPKPYVKGIPTGLIAPGSNLDIDEWVGTEEQWNTYINKEAPDMIGTYNQLVPQLNRARLVMISDHDKQINIVKMCESVDGIIFKTVSQATGNMTVHKDTGFQTWVDRSTVANFGMIELDQNLFWNKEIDLNKFSARTMWVNETLRAFIDQWRSVPIPTTEWDAKKLNINNINGWHKLDAIILYMSSIYTRGQKVNGMWQQAVVDDLLKPLTTLMEGGFIPNVPIYLVANTDWYLAYQYDPTWVIKNRIESKQLAGLGVMRTWGREEEGLITEVAPQAVPYNTLEEVWKNVPKDTYKYPVTFDYANFQFHIFSYNRLLAKDMFYDGATLSTVTCGTWCDTVDVMYDTLDVGPVQPPVETSDLEERVKALELLVSKLVAWKENSL